MAWETKPAMECLTEIIIPHPVLGIRIEEHVYKCSIALINTEEGGFANPKKASVKGRSCNLATVTSFKD